MFSVPVEVYAVISVQIELYTVLSHPNALVQNLAEKLIDFLAKDRGEPLLTGGEG